MMIEPILDRIEDEQTRGQTPSTSDLQTLLHCDLAKEFFRIVQWCASRQQMSWPMLGTFAHIFGKERFLPGWNLLSQHLGAPDDPMEWDVRAKEFGFIVGCLLFTDAFPASTIGPVVDFSLRRLCSDLLMSSTFHGCGDQVSEEWCSPEFYASLLHDQPRLLEPLPKDFRIPMTKRILGHVARLFESAHIPRLQIGIGAGEVYYAMPSATESLERTLRAMREKKMDPVIVAGIFAGVLKAETNRVFLDASAVRADWLDSERGVRTPLGRMLYRAMISELRQLAGPGGDMSPHM